MAKIWEETAPSLLRLHSSLAEKRWQSGLAETDALASAPCWSGSTVAAVVAVWVPSAVLLPGSCFPGSGRGHHGECCQNGQRNITPERVDLDCLESGLRCRKSPRVHRAEGREEQRLWWEVGTYDLLECSGSGWVPTAQPQPPTSGDSGFHGQGGVGGRLRAQIPELPLLHHGDR